MMHYEVLLIFVTHVTACHTRNVTCVTCHYWKIHKLRENMVCLCVFGTPSLPLVFMFAKLCCLLLFLKYNFYMLGVTCVTLASDITEVSFCPLGCHKWRL